jgi:hypothetical protein
MPHVVGDFSYRIFNAKQLVDRFESADHHCGTVENDRDSVNRKNNSHPSTGLQRIYSADPCVYSLVSKKKEKMKLPAAPLDGVSVLLRQAAGNSGEDE